MAKNYGKKHSTRRNSSLPGQLLLVFVAFFFGYLSASLYDFTRLSGWVGTHVLAQQNGQNPTKPSIQQAQLPKPKFEFYTLLANERVAGGSSPATTSSNAMAAQARVPASTAQVAAAGAANLPPYVSANQAGTAAPMDLAVNQKLPLHAPLSTVAAEVKTSNAGDFAKDAYLIQVGSFKMLREAERMKASLTMKGFDVKIASTHQQGMYWYRVIIGPFASKLQAQKAQMDFARSEHITGMIRKMDA